MADLEQVQMLQAPEGALLDLSATSSHFFNLNVGLSAILENQELLKSCDPLIQELYKRGFSFSELNSRMACGTDMGNMMALCGCGVKLVPLHWNCNNKTCPICSKYRSNRIRRKLQPFLQKYDTERNSREFLGMITFSPENFDTIEEGYIKIRKDFAKFLRLKYVKERVYGGFPVIEVKTKNYLGERKGWNIHIHFIYYGRFLDNRIRGYCEDCGQNLIKQDRYNKKYYCANRKCNSTNVKVNGDSKLVKLWKKSSGKQVIIDVQRLNSHQGAIRYVTKYVSHNKDDFYDIKDQADYIVYMKNKRMISAVGSFFKQKLPLAPIICKCCGLKTHFFFDEKVVYELEQMKKVVIPPPDEKIIEYEIIKI